MKQRGFRYCPTCNTKLQKRGLTAAGNQRWLCPNCKASATKPRLDLRQNRLLDQFVDWLLGKRSQAELDMPDRTWREKTAWCWDVIPKPTRTGEAHPILLLDGIRIGSLVCLVARTPQHVVSWAWVPYESSGYWDKLLEPLPAPAVAVCDGQKGILVSIPRNWHATAVQRCHFHVWQNVRTKLTLHPQTIAGQQLLQLTRGLLKGIVTPEKADLWIHYLVAWEQEHGHFLRERTYIENPKPGQRKWRYTHERLRSAYRQLTKLLKDGQLFAYLDEALIAQTAQPIPRTTNYVEGGINSQLRTKLKLHRGMSEEHQRRLVEWYLYSRTENPKPPRFCR
jgi:hypothetical protein